MSRRRFVALCVVLVFIAGAPARADELADARQLARGGQILTGIGGGFQLAGAGLIMGGAFMPSGAFAIGAEGGGGYSASRNAEAKALFIGGIAASVVGDVVVIIGCSQWIVGGRRIKRLRADR